MTSRVKTLETLVAELKAYAKEQGWQDMDDPIAALLYWEPPVVTPHETRDPIIERAELALSVIAAICNGKQRWVMSVPARPDEDPDLVLASAIRALTEANAADAQTIATLRAKVERSGDALAIERGLVTIYRNDVERHAQTIAALRDENARLKAELEQATRAIQGKALRKALTQRQEQSKP